MEILYITGDDALSLEPCVATVGFFDGVHAGHRHVIAQVKDLAQKQGRRSCVVTFEKHPRQVVSPGFSPQLLTTLEEKIHLLEIVGVDVCAVLRFDKRMAAMDAATFMKSVLSDILNVRHLIVGYDNRFGHNRSEGYADYIDHGRKIGMDVTVCDEEDVEGQKVSSSLIRKCLEDGNVERTTACLGYPYSLCGKVVGGFHRGREMGFPTANLEIPDNGKLFPVSGVYAVKAWLENDNQPRKAMMNIGTRPTFHGRSLSLEVHILEFTGNLYGQLLRVEFMHRIREEKPFEDMKTLAAQLQQDRVEVEKWFNNHQ